MAAESKRAIRPHPQQMVKCPRCESPDTKFCYYNNYSTTQPRYFCKNCKRYWTDGGTLRNVPVGGGLRKNKRSAKPKVSNNTSSSPPLPPSSSSSHHKTSSSTPSSCNILSNIATSHALLNLSNENHHALPHSSSMPNSGYLVFNPRIYEGGDQATPHPNMPYQEANFSHQIVPPSPLSIIGGLKQQGPLSTSHFLSGYGHERTLSESLQQPAGFHHNSSMDTSANYTMTNFVNVNDWQQISEGLFGGAGGETNFMFMQPPQPPQWADFDSGTRL